MSRAGTPTDNGYAERFVGLFKLAVADRRPYHTLGEFLRAAQAWTQFYNSTRPHQSLKYRSPDQFAREQGLPAVPPITLLCRLGFWRLDSVKVQGVKSLLLVCFDRKALYVIRQLLAIQDCLFY
jgi:hypothetical protein